MALISAKTIITSVALFHITLGFFFLTNPGTIADQALVWVIGEAMGMPYSRNFENQSPALAFLAVVLVYLGITDLSSFSLPEDICIVQHWGVQAPLRLTISFALCFYTFAFGPSSPLYQTAPQGARFNHPSAAHHPPGYRAASWGGDHLKNRVFFTFAFVEVISWFWIWVTLREEQRDILARKAMRRRGSHGSAGF